MIQWRYKTWQLLIYVGETSYQRKSNQSGYLRKILLLKKKHFSLNLHLCIICIVWLTWAQLSSSLNHIF